MAEGLTPRHGCGPHGERSGEAVAENSELAANRAEARLDAWRDELLVEAAAERRRRERWLRTQALDDTTIASVLLVHAERSSSVAITTLAGGRYTGRVSGANNDLVVIDTRLGRVVVELDCIETLRSAPRPDGAELAPADHRRSGETATMADVLSLALAGRPEVTLVTRSGEKVRGELVGVGQDVAIVRPADLGPLVYSPIAALSEALLERSAASG